MFRVLLVLQIISLGLGHLASIFSIGDTSVYLFDLLMAFFVFSSIIYLFVSKSKLVIPETFIPFLLFFVIAVISLVINSYRLSSTELLFSAMYPIRFFIYLVFGIALFNLVKLGRLSLNFVKHAVLFGALFVSIAGFVQLIVLPDFSVMDSSLGWDPHKNRLASAFLDPNFTGCFLFLSLFLSFMLGERPGLASIIVFLATFLTFSRSTWGALAVAVLVLGVMKYRKLLLISFLVAFLAYFAVPRVQTRISGITDPSDSAAFRLESWKNALVLAKENLAFGVGFNTYRYIQLDRGLLSIDLSGSHSGAGSDSSFLLVLATTGILGFIVFCFGYFYPVYVSLRECNYIFAAAMMGLFLQTQFINALFYPQVLFVWMAMLATYSAFFSYRKV